MKYLFLENKNKQAVRTFLWDESSIFAVKCLETGRFELWTARNLENNKHIPLQILGPIPEHLPPQGLFFPQVGTLKQGKPTTQIQCDVEKCKQDRFFDIQSFLIVLLMFCFLGFVLQIQTGSQQSKDMTAHIVPQEVNNRLLSIKNPNIPLKSTVQQNKASPSLLAILAAAQNNTQKLKIDLNINEVPSDIKHSATQTYQYDKGIFSIPSISKDLEGGSIYSKESKTGATDRDINLNIGSVQIAETTDKITSTNKGLDEEKEQALNAFISRQEGLLRICYERGLQVFDEFRGSVFLIWAVDHSGMAQNIRIAKLQMNSNSVVNLNEFKTCIVDYLKLWLFPAILKGETIHYKFQFNRL